MFNVYLHYSQNMTHYNRIVEDVWPKKQKKLKKIRYIYNYIQKSHKLKKR